MIKEICLKYSSRNILLDPRSKVTQRSRCDVAHLQPLTNIPAKSQLPTHYTLLYPGEIFQTQCHYSKVKRKIKVKPPRYKPKPPKPMPLHSINILHFMVSEIPHQIKYRHDGLQATLSSGQN